MPWNGPRPSGPRVGTQELVELESGGRLLPPGLVPVDDPTTDGPVEAFLKEKLLLLGLFGVTCGNRRIEFLHTRFQMCLHRLIACPPPDVLSVTLLR